ncbi:unnamed protein product [Camellia sinensis]
MAEAPDFVIGHSSNLDAVTRHDRRSRKCTILDMLNLILSLQCLELQSGFSKRKKIMDSGFSRQISPQVLISSKMIGKTEGCSYASLLAEANNGNAPSSIFVSALLHVVRHCSLCIKHARLSSQMDALDISYVEEVDSHIRYDPEGVVLSHHSVEADSIKKLVADIQRLSNARMFALGMRKLLGVRPDEKLEEDSANSNSKAAVGAKI